MGVDLREDWPKALLAAGFQASEPTAWLVEGLLMYLAEDERNRLLDRVGDLSASGSRLALEQKGVDNREHRALPSDALGHGGERIDEDARRSGEALIARLGVNMSVGQLDPSRTDPGAWLARHGWRGRIYSAAERFGFYGRPVPALLEAGMVQLSLGSAERS